MRYLLPLIIVLFSGVATADPIEKAVKARQGYFAMLSTNMGPMSAMLKGKRDYDEATAAMHASNIETLSQYGLTMHFPKGSSTDELGEATDSKPEIWDNLDDFAQKFADFREAAIGAGDGVEGGKENLGAVARSDGGLQQIGKLLRKLHQIVPDLRL